MKKLSHKTRSRFLLLIISMITITVTSAFVILWMQQGINRIVQSSVALENELSETKDKLHYLDQRISRAHKPFVLQGQNCWSPEACDRPTNRLDC